MTRWLRRQAVAHRGLHGAGVPENSIAAFRAAIAAGVAIELDVRLSADGAPVVFHDERLERLTGAPGLVETCPASELRALRLLGTDERVPLLSDALRFVRGRVPLLVEVKQVGRDRRLERRVAQLLRVYGGGFALQSFDPSAVRRLKILLPSAPCGLLCGSAARRPDGRPDFFACDVGARKSSARRLGVPLLLWTVRTNRDRAIARRLGANIIFEAGGAALPRTSPGTVALGNPVRVSARGGGG